MVFDFSEWTQLSNFLTFYLFFFWNFASGIIPLHLNRTAQCSKRYIFPIMH